MKGNCIFGNNETICDIVTVFITFFAVATILGFLGSNIRSHCKHIILSHPECNSATEPREKKGTSGQRATGQPAVALYAESGNQIYNDSSGLRESAIPNMESAPTVPQNNTEKSDHTFCSNDKESAFHDIDTISIYLYILLAAITGLLYTRIKKIHIPLSLPMDMNYLIRLKKGIINLNRIQNKCNDIDVIFSEIQSLNETIYLNLAAQRSTFDEIEKTLKETFRSIQERLKEIYLIVPLAFEYPQPNSSPEFMNTLRSELNSLTKFDSISTEIDKALQEVGEIERKLKVVKNEGNLSTIKDHISKVKSYMHSIIRDLKNLYSDLKVIREYPNAEYTFINRLTFFLKSLIPFIIFILIALVSVNILVALISFNSCDNFLLLLQNSLAITAFFIFRAIRF